MGDDPDAPHMRKARELILRLGGAEKCNSFTKFYFAGLGQISYDACPSIPPEIVLLPKWFYFNLYHVSAWTRTMILPLALVTTLRPVRKLPSDLGIDELYHRSAKPPIGWPIRCRAFRRTGAISFSASISCSRPTNECPLAVAAQTGDGEGREVAAGASG